MWMGFFYQGTGMADTFTIPGAMAGWTRPPARDERGFAHQSRAKDCISLRENFLIKKNQN